MKIRLALLLLAAALTLSADELVFAGTPSIRIDADGRDTKKVPNAQSAVCKIVRRGRHYFWGSRENRRLDRIDAGDYVYYISPEGSGYVKVRKQPQRGAGFDYMEHLSSGFTTVTYWGRAD